MNNIQNLISQMTLEEKAGLCSGADFWHLKGIARLGVPSIMVTDGPHGLRKQAGAADHVGLNESVPATCFPTASALAATWNRDLIRQVGIALGEECRQEKVGVILGPGANIKRSPLCGRNFEYFSEDPYLTGEIAKSHIAGVQSQGIGTSLKHYATNNQETRRMTTDSIVDERALREIYLTGYEIAVKGAQPWTVMCAYNKVNGVYACENRYLMTDILKEEWGHQGLVVTDWGAMDERVDALQAGVELEMPGAPNGNDAKIVAAVKAGVLDEAVLDRAVARILTLIFKAADTLAQDFTYDRQAHHELARRVAGEGAVLLKNEGRLLPLPADARIALIGRFARTPRYQGAGSSLINPTRLDNLHDELIRLVGAERVTYAAGYTEKGEAADEALIQEALAAARQADVVVICAGLTDMYEVEGLDRDHMHLPPGHDALIQRVAAAHEKVVVVLSNGAPVEMPWCDAVPAILEGYLGGQAGAGALADILTGRVNPSGKLAETFPRSLSDVPAQPYPGGPVTVEYCESLYVGYRYYDAAQQPVLFPFGHGLSYTTFAYRDLTVEAGADSVTVTFRVRNTGDRAGQEIAQVYVRDVAASHFRPDKGLQGFDKIALQPGEEKTVTLELDRRAFAFYDAGRKEWVLETGDFEILVGASSRDVRLAATVSLTSDQRPAPYADSAALAPYFSPIRAPFSRDAFAALYGRPLPENTPPQKGQYTLNTPISEMQGSFVGRQLFHMMQDQIRKMMVGQEDTPTGAMMMSMVQEMPLRSMLMMGGTFNREKLEALLAMINGHFFSGLWAFLRANKSARKS
ncbi:MAG: glycosyl hydrolase [Chloroflexi bacterium]|nr:glycosyl hydrolase [Chloroflexota bacterium]OQB02643.1 MAG: Thermostable beta-glucosidase B [Chloroflexi bacterium ADurb.Bin222]HOC21448.1 glycoside hydrolase family 3 C-terminal domain-containing protein [Anaerolineae bacterium]HOS80183.1 glycoside hydrolase family 3 C-terminal domain-containing protein [Anaerolineae bacterium]HQJ12012.1 glycoside hydrolase family 3 C-terminal domain-containing protein [Anaerolineae bacterium]